MEENGNLCDSAHLHKRIIRLSGHVHGRGREMLVKLAVKISQLPQFVATFRMHTCQDATTDSNFAAVTIFNHFQPSLANFAQRSRFS